MRRSKMGPDPLYPWQSWFDGHEHVLESGVDFDAGRTPEEFRPVVLNTARRYGVRVKTSMFRNGRALVVHAPRDIQGGEPRRPGRPVKYDWPALFDGGSHRLVRGRDFPDASIETFRMMALRAARKAKVEIRTKVFSDEILVIEPADFDSPANPRLGRFFTGGDVLIERGRTTYESTDAAGESRIVRRRNFAGSPKSLEAELRDYATERGIPVYIMSRGDGVDDEGQPTWAGIRIIAVPE